MLPVRSSQKLSSASFGFSDVSISSISCGVAIYASGGIIVSGRDAEHETLTDQTVNGDQINARVREHEGKGV